MREFDTGKKYSFLWSRYKDASMPEKYHFDYVQEVIPERIVRGSIGLDLGCGRGWDTFIMAKGNPHARIVGMDISEAIYATSQRSHKPKNAVILRGSAASIPLKDEICDFVYSFGVLHHMHDYKSGISEIYRVLKKGNPAYIYLYEDHSENFLKYIAIKIIAVVRKLTVGIPPRVLYCLSCLFSPILILIFSYPARILKRYKATYKLYERMPFNFGRDLFSLRGDIYDRFAAPVENRFSRQAVQSIFEEFNFTGIRITRLKATAGWVIQAYK